MTEIYFRQAASIVVEDPSETDAIQPLKEGLPRRAQRRMTLMGLMMHRLLEGRELSGESSIVYLTEFGESRTMNKYLASYPMPSPMGFQASIHPSGVEQGLILRGQPVRFFLPLGGRDAIFQAVRVAADLPAGSLLGGAEECEFGLASDDLSSRRTFAWALTLATPETADGCLEWTPAAPAEAIEGTLFDLARAIPRRDTWACTRTGLGQVRLRWL